MTNAKIWSIQAIAEKSGVTVLDVRNRLHTIVPPVTPSGFQGQYFDDFSAKRIISAMKAWADGRKEGLDLLAKVTEIQAEVKEIKRLLEGKNNAQTIK